MPTASELLLNLSIQVEGEEDLKTLGEELAALEAEQFKYNKQAQQSTIITEKVEAATSRNKKEFQALRAEVGRQIASNKHSEETVQALNKVHGLLSDQIRMAQSTIMKYGQETLAANDKQKAFANTTKDLKDRLQALKDRSSDLQRSMKGSSSASAEQTLEFKRISDRARELERDADRLTKAYFNTREETNAYRKVLVGVRDVQTKLSSVFRQSDSDFARLTKRIAGINKEVNKLRSEFFESDLRAEALVDSNTDLAEANKIVEEENKRNIEVMKVHRGLLRDLREEVDALSASQELTAQESQKLSTQLNSATQNAGVSQRALQNLNATFGTSTQVKNRATQALISFSQGLQDAPQFTFGFAAGIRAIANNMTQFQQLTTLLGDSIAQTTGKTATFGQKLRALLAALKGPAGGLILFTAITSAVTVFSAMMSKARKETEGLATSLDDLTSTLTGYQSTLGADEFGVDNLMLQKAALEDIQSVYEGQLRAVQQIKRESNIFQRSLEGTLRLLSGVLGPAGISLAPTQISAEQFEGIGFGPAEAKQIEGFTQEQQRAVLALRESRDALEDQLQQVGLSTKEIDELGKTVNQLNNQIEINNRLSALRPLGQRIAELGKQAKLLELDVEFGEISIEQAERMVALLEQQKREAKEQVDATRNNIQTLNLVPTRKYQGFHTSITDIANAFNESGMTADDFRTTEAELNAELADGVAFVSRLSANIEIFKNILNEANNERQRELDLEREKQLLTVDTQTLLALTIAEGIEDERQRANAVFEIELASLKRRTALRQGVSEADIKMDEQYVNELARLRISLHNTLLGIQQEELEALENEAEEKRRIAERERDGEIKRREESLKLDREHADLRLSIERQLANSRMQVNQMLVTSLQSSFSALFGQNKAVALLNLAVEKGLAIAKVIADSRENAAELEAESVKLATIGAAYSLTLNPLASQYYAASATAKAGAVKTLAVGKKNAAKIAAIGLLQGAGALSGGGGGGGAAGAGASGSRFGMKTVEGEQRFRTPQYQPSRAEDSRGAETTVQIMADRKQLYALVNKGQQEYNSIRATT